VLVLDNGGPPATRAWLDAVDDPRLRVVHLPDNIHPTAARNTALRAAAGTWVGFCDDDDLWAPDKARVMVEAAEAAGADWVCCGCAYVDADGVVTGGRPVPALEDLVGHLPVAYTVPGGLSGLMWRRAALPEGPIDERMAYVDDWDLALQLVRLGPPAVVDRPLLGFRQHGGAHSRDVGPLLAEYRLIAEKHADLRRGADVRRDRHHRYVGGQALRAGDRREAASHYVRAIRLGDLASIPRLAATALPPRAQERLRRGLLSDRPWMAEAQRWIDAVPADALPAPSTPAQ
jgi:glycosyltransferase involved in cell wall biosynthesis